MAGKSAACVVPWLLEREYTRHRTLDPSLPVLFKDWREHCLSEIDTLKKTQSGRIVRFVVHPGELEAWTGSCGRAVDAAAREDFARALLDAGRGRYRSHRINPLALVD